MTVAQPTNQEPEKKQNDKELNFRALEQKYQKELQQERAARLEAERLVKERTAIVSHGEDDEDDDEPYVDKKKLKKTLNKFGEQNKQQTQMEIKQAVDKAREEAKMEAWLDNNSDFYEVLEHAEKLAQRSPALAKSILAMPEGFERQKLVYQNIKELGLNKPAQKEPSIQQKIDANRKAPFYQPSGVGTAPYQSTGDFSPAGQKQAYDKMQELKNRLRLG